MKVTFYILSIFTLFVSIITASKDVSIKKYPVLWQNRLYTILTGGFDKVSAQPQSMRLLMYIDGSEDTAVIQRILKDADKSPFDLYSILTKTLHPEFAELSIEYYKEQRGLLGVPDEFNEFDANFYKKLDALTYLFHTGVAWDELRVLSGNLSIKNEVVCETAYFYDLMDFERALTCLDAAPRTTLTAKIFSNFVADMYFGEATREDFSYEGDADTRKWLDGMVKKYKGGYLPETSSLMRHFTHNIRGRVDKELWTNYMRAMMTVHLSASLLMIRSSGLKDLYDYLADNRITDGFMFASRFSISEGSHAFLRTFKFNPINETATMGIINSGAGISSHDSKSFDLSELPDTISKNPHVKSVIRYIPFIVYDAVSRKDWGPAYITVDSVTKAYFEDEQKKRSFDNYQRWQYIDDQRSGTCTAMSLWSGLYWFEQESQQNLESFRLTLYLEVLNEAAKELHKLRTELREMGDQIFEMTDGDPGRGELQRRIDEKSGLEDDFLRFFSVGFNSAIRSIRYLHTDPSGPRLDMTAVMQDYVTFYELQASEEYWQLIKPNIDSLYYSTYDRVLKPEKLLSIPIAPKISAKEHGCVNEVNQAIKSKNPFNFVKAVISGTGLKCQSKTFLASIHSGIDGLDLQIHHQDLILRGLAKEVRSLSGGRLSIFRLVQRLINDYNFILFPTYDVLPTEGIDFGQESRQIFIFDDDTEMKQFAVNCAAFDAPANNVLTATYELVRSVEKTLPDLVTRVNIEDTEEYKLHENLVQRVIAELQSMDPHTHARCLSDLIRNAGQTGIDEYIDLFKPSEEWDQNDYVLLENATKQQESIRTSIWEPFDRHYSLKIGRNFASKHLSSLSSNLSEDDDDEYILAGKINRTIDADSPLNFVKAIISGVKERSTSELFLLSITLGINALKLQPHHQSLILRTFLWHKSVSKMSKFIDQLITMHGFKLFYIDDVTRPSMGKYTSASFFREGPKLRDESEAKQLAVNLNADESNASIVLILCNDYDDLAELRPSFIDRVFKELREMNPHLHAYHLSRLMRQEALKSEDFDSAAFRPSTEWTDYDYVLIENAAIDSYQKKEVDKFFIFPKEYHINTEKARKGTAFRLMGANPSEETLKEYAIMLFDKMKDSYRE